MKRKTLGLGIAALVAVGILSTSAYGLTVFGNNSQKGSLLIFPRIDVTPGAPPDSAPSGAAAATGTDDGQATGTDTLITITNDSSNAVRLKCYYATSDPVPTPNPSSAAGLRNLKHFEDFTIDLTHNQPIAWWARSGLAYSSSQTFGGFVAPPFGNPFPDGQTRPEGELKCWAATDDLTTEKVHNHLFGTASVFIAAGTQAYEYSAWAFQAFGAPESALGSPGVLSLNNVEYDACPNILLGNFLASGTGNASRTQVTLASCNQDLR